MAKGKLSNDFYVIVAGSRTFNDTQYIFDALDYYLQDIRQRANVIIVSGDAPKGADAVAKVYAAQRQLPLELFPAQWRIDGKLNRGAGFLRNTQMADYAHALVAFWDGQSRGTKDMIDKAIDRQLKVRIVKLID